MLGEMTWLLSQSPLHNVLQLKDLEWLVMPALIHEQFYLFRDGDKPVGLALWPSATRRRRRSSKIA
jgi:cytolysin-activating lysine-acyltransferase